MKRKTLIALFTGLLALSLLLSHSVNAAESSGQSAGTITGRVSNAVSRANLEGASVSIEGTQYWTLTERGGSYELHVPSGSYTLTVAYTGLDTQSFPVTVEAGGTARQDIALTAEIYRLNPFTVTGEREGNALAVTLQRESQGIKNIVSTDAFGALAGNPVDLLVRLPGIEGQAVSGDLRYIRIRGLHQGLSTVTMDGNRAASANGAGTDRVFEFGPGTGSDLIERIEVVKSPTPDMDGDSIGGAVNLVSKSAFDRTQKRYITGSVGGVWRPLTDQDDPIHQSYSFSYSEIFNKRLGVAFNFASRVHGTPEEITNGSWETLPAGVSRPRFQSLWFWENLQVYDRSGLSLGLKLDFKLSDRSRISFNTTMNRYGEHAWSYGASFSTTASLATVDASGNPTGAGGGILPGYTANTTQWRGNTVNPATGAQVISPSVLNVWMRTTERRNYVAQNTLSGEHKFAGLVLDWSAYQSKAKISYPGNKRLDLFARGFGFRVERPDDEPFYATIAQTSGPDYTQIANYNSNNNNTYTINLRKTAWDQFRGLSINLKKDFATVAPASIKLGVRHRGQIRDGDNTAYRGNYVGADGVMGPNPAGVNDDNLAQFVHPLNNPELKFSKRLSRYPRLPYPRRMALPGGGPGNYSNDRTFNIDTAFERTPQLFRDDIAFNIMQNLQGFTHFAEDINAAYIQGSVSLGKLTILGGVRVEETEVLGRGTGATLTAEERARRAAWVGVVTDDELRRRTIAQYGTMTENEGDYRNVLPGLHFKYRPIPSIVTRLGYATNIGRPDISNMIARTTADPDARTVSASNPGLKPQTANNFDFSIEHYNRSAGILSAGIFLKELKNFIFNRSGTIIPPGQDNGFDGDYAGYALTTKANGGFAKVKGLELNYMQQLTFLPGWMSGFGVYANYTRLDIEGHYNAGNAVPDAPTSEVAGFTPTLYNVGISYIKNRLSLRLQFNHRGRYLVSFNANQSALPYQRDRDVLDIKAGYQLSKHFDLYVNVDNVLNEADAATELYGGQPTALIKINPLFSFGINARY